MEQRKYKKTIRFYLSNVFGKWGPTRWIFFILAIIALLLGGNISINYINNGVICLGYCNDVKIQYVDDLENNKLIPDDYRKIQISFSASEEEKKFQEGISYGDVRFYLDYTKEYFVLPDFNRSGTYNFGRCNDELTDCYINDRYNFNNYVEQELCFEVIVPYLNPSVKTYHSFWFEPTGFCPESRIIDLVFNIGEIEDFYDTLLLDKYNNLVYIDHLPKNYMIHYGLYDTVSKESYIKPQNRCDSQSIKTLSLKTKRGDYKYKVLQNPLSCKEATMQIRYFLQNDV